MHTSLWKVTMCDVSRSVSIDQDINHENDQCLGADTQYKIEPPRIPLIKLDLEELYTPHIIKFMFPRNPSRTTSETYYMKMSTFDDVQP